MKSLTLLYLNSCVSSGSQMPSPTMDWCFSPQNCFRREVHVEVSHQQQRTLSDRHEWILISCSGWSFERNKQSELLLDACYLFVVSYLHLVSKGNKIEPRCSLECKYLNSDDYKDLLWTTLSEFPGTHQIYFSAFYLIINVNFCVFLYDQSQVKYYCRV